MTSLHRRPPVEKKAMVLFPPLPRFIISLWMQTKDFKDWQFILLTFLPWQRLEVRNSHHIFIQQNVINTAWCLPTVFKQTQHAHVSSHSRLFSYFDSSMASLFSSPRNPSAFSWNVFLQWHQLKLILRNFFKLHDCRTVHCWDWKFVICNIS